MTLELIRLAWWAIPVAGIAAVAYLAGRALRQTPALLGAVAGCLIGAFVPEPAVYAQSRDVESAVLGGLWRTLSHTAWCSAWGAVAGGLTAAVAWRWIRRAHRPGRVAEDPQGGEGL